MSAKCPVAVTRKLQHEGYDRERAVDVAYSNKRLIEYGCGPRKSYTSAKVKKCMKDSMSKDKSLSEKSAYKACSKTNT